MVEGAAEGERPAHAVRCLKEAGPRSVWLIQRPGEEPRTLKSWPLTLPAAAKLIVGGAQAQRQRRSARRTARLKIPTPDPAGRCVVRRRGGRWLIELELRYVPGRSVLEILRGGDVDARLAGAAGRQLAHIVRTLADAGFTHRDLTISNCVIQDATDGPVVWLIDTVGIRRTRDRLKGMIRMIERLSALAVWRPAARPPWVWTPFLREVFRGLPTGERRETLRILRRDITWPALGRGGAPRPAGPLDPRSEGDAACSSADRRTPG